MPGAAYDDPALHRVMLLDKVRNEAYRRALNKLVKPGKVVLDVGAGTGILSLFAAKAGAKRVYAVERTITADIARDIVKANALSEVIRVIPDDIENAELPEKVDLLVSEWMGGYGIDENVHTPVLLARDRWLKPGGIMVPLTVTAWMAPVWDPKLEQDMAYWRTKPHGVDLSIMGDIMGGDMIYCQHHIGLENVLAKPQQLWTTNMKTISLENAKKPHKASLRFKAQKDGSFSALAAWFTADFGGGVSLSTAPGSPPTHWDRTLFSLFEPLKVKRNADIEVTFTCEPAGPGFCRGGWSIKVGNMPWEHYMGHENMP